jgi:hypothetical protein
MISLPLPWLNRVAGGLLFAALFLHVYQDGRGIAAQEQAGVEKKTAFSYWLGRKPDPGKNVVVFDVAVPAAEAA